MDFRAWEQKLPGQQPPWQGHQKCQWLWRRIWAFSESVSQASGSAGSSRSTCLPFLQQEHGGPQMPHTGDRLHDPGNFGWSAVC